MLTLYCDTCSKLITILLQLHLHAASPSSNQIDLLYVGIDIDYNSSMDIREAMIGDFSESLNIFKPFSANSITWSSQIHSNNLSAVADEMFECV